MEYVLALDQGTTSSRAILYDRDGAIRSIAQRELQQIYPRAGWVEALSRANRTSFFSSPPHQRVESEKQETNPQP